MTFIIWFLTAVLVLDCLFLILLVLVQLPKKEAGAGQAFGAGATDALFGAGTGNVLTKITKYSAAVFLGLCLLLSLLISRKAGLSGKGVEKLLQSNVQRGKPAAPAAMPTPSNLLSMPQSNRFQATNFGPAESTSTLSLIQIPTNPATTNAAPTNPAPPKQP